MKAFLFCFSFLLFINKVNSQEIRLRADSVVRWTKKNGTLVDPETSILPVKGIAIHIDTTRKLITVFNKLEDTYTIKQRIETKDSMLLKRNCIWNAMDGDYRCIISVRYDSATSMFKNLKIEFSATVNIYYDRRNDYHE